MEEKTIKDETIEITDKASKRIKAILDSDGKEGYGLRV